MSDLERLILEAWERVWPMLRDDPAELRKRLARRRSPTLTRPFRHDCVAVRASDRRITPAHWVIYPEHAVELNHEEHPYEPIEHEVTIQTHALRKYCRPVRIDGWGAELPSLCKQLGCFPSGLVSARRNNQFRERKIRIRGGKNIIPILHHDRWLDPCSGHNFSPPDPILGALWEFLPDMIPDKFEQTITRTPVFRRMHGNHNLPCDPAEVFYSDEVQLIGWRWICPGCKKQVRTFYYPLKVRTLCDFINFDPAIPSHPSDTCFPKRRFSKSQLRRQARLRAGRRRRFELDFVQRPLPTFACKKCHKIQYHCSVNRLAWNNLIGQLTAGLLYGCEVEKPAWYKPLRKRRRIRHLHARTPHRRQQVLRRLLNGWSTRRIARDLMVTRAAINNHIRILCEQENVPDRHALVAKLGGKCSPPLNMHERAAKRQLLVKDLLLAGLNAPQIAARLEIDTKTVHNDCVSLYRQYNIVGAGPHARHALAAKLGHQIPPSEHQLLRQKIHSLHQSGLKTNEIAQHLNITYQQAYRHLRARGTGVPPVSPTGTTGVPPVTHNSEL